MLTHAYSSLLRQIKQFEGDYNFDYPLFRDIIDKCKISFADIKATELRILSSVDLTVLTSATTYDFVRCLSHRFGIDQIDKLESYYKFMDDLCLYSLMSDQYAINVATNCLMGSLIYFAARNDGSVLERIYSIFKLIVEKRDYEVQNLTTHRDFTLLKLKELGAKDEEISMISKKINVELCLAR